MFCSQEAADKLSAKLTGVPKSTAHKAAIAITMRRRHAAIRVLRAVEEVHRQHSPGSAAARRASIGSSSSGSSAGTGPGDSASPTPGSQAAGGQGSGREVAGVQRGGTRLPAGLVGMGHLGSSNSRRMSKGQILNGFKAQLHEYRVLQEELEPWTKAFTAQHGRKPRLMDVERTGGRAERG